MSEANNDPLWRAILQETEQAVRDEPLLASFLHMTVLRHATLEDVLAFHLSSKLASPVMDARALLELFREALAADAQISRAMRAAGWMSALITSEMRFCRKYASVFLSCCHSQWVMRWLCSAWKPLKYKSGVE